MSNDQLAEIKKLASKGGNDFLEQVDADTVLGMVAEIERLRAELAEAERMEESAASGAASMLRYAERVTALYREERAIHRPGRTGEPEADRYDAETEANLKAVLPG